MNDIIEAALAKFNEENPNGDSFELALYFYNLGRKHEEENIKKQRELEKNLPPYYGN